MRSISVLKKIRQRMVISFTRRKQDSGYCYRAGDVVVDDFAEFSGIPLDVVVERVANFHRINADDWNALGASSFSERAATFYESSHNFIFGILSANPSPNAVIEKLNRFNPRILEAIRAHPGKKFFEFGGGIGVFCEIAARMGKHVYYMELPGIVFDFAQWRFSKLGLDIKVFAAKSDVIYLPGKYDIIYTDAVLEHLPRSLQIEATKAIAQSGRQRWPVDFLGRSVRPKRR